MIRKMKKIIAISAVAVLISSCIVTEHTVGNGAQGNNEVSIKAWYALYGIVPLNKQDVNSKRIWYPKGLQTMI